MTTVVGTVLFIRKGLEAIEFVAGRRRHYVAAVRRQLAPGEERSFQQENLQEIGNAAAVVLARLDAEGIDESEFSVSNTSSDVRLSKFTLTLGMWFLLGAKRANARGLGSTVVVAKLLFVLVTLLVAAIPS